MIVADGYTIQTLKWASAQLCSANLASAGLGLDNARRMFLRVHPEGYELLVQHPQADSRDRHLEELINHRQHLGSRWGGGGPKHRNIHKSGPATSA